MGCDCGKQTNSESEVLKFLQITEQSSDSRILHHIRHNCELNNVVWRNVITIVPRDCTVLTVLTVLAVLAVFSVLAVLTVLTELPVFTVLTVLTNFLKNLLC